MHSLIRAASFTHEAYSDVWRYETIALQFTFKSTVLNFIFLCCTPLFSLFFFFWSVGSFGRGASLLKQYFKTATLTIPWDIFEHFWCSQQVLKCSRGGNWPYWWVTPCKKIYGGVFSFRYITFLQAHGVQGCKNKTTLETHFCESLERELVLLQTNHTVWQ